MGQYHGAYNLTKKEYIGPHALCSGAKLMEWGMGDGYMGMALALLLSNSNGRGGGDLYIEQEFDNETCDSIPLTGYKAELQGMIDAISGRWAGDKIVVQGDYAEKGDPGFISKKEIGITASLNRVMANVATKNLGVRPLVCF